MPACELRPATQYDTDAVYALICELNRRSLTITRFAWALTPTCVTQTCATIWRCWMAKLSA